MDKQQDLAHALVDGASLLEAERLRTAAKIERKLHGGSMSLRTKCRRTESVYSRFHFALIRGVSVL